ncbi:U11/U12 small nuclear ribonucleoprotein 25 kDa protein [Bagarius yarrelli]|uniref:U11/U12 small nuclear ribonucleoprotein 25 kDa protein n=1 Tax=Bagarius yarrelli TaxID=175774 RepID=A0A556V8L5_BAGYA|nr:U11/U12 small nuclear ribonucleoprotein 25 kDa protein [Bagarius yarrelli]
MSSEIKTDETENKGAHEPETEIRNREEKLKEEEEEKDGYEEEEEDEEALPHSEFLDIFEEAIVVVQSATVLDLKKAIRRYYELKQQREGGIKHISWRYVWRTFDLVFNGERLEDDKKKLKEIERSGVSVRRLVYSMGSAENQRDLEKILFELQTLTVQRQQLSNRLRLLTTLKEFRQKAGYQKGAELKHNSLVVNPLLVAEAAEKDECEKIEDELKQLSERKLQLQALQEKLEGSVSGDTFSGTQKHHPLSNQIFMVESPPPYPAPQVITDMNKLARHPAQIQCPHCEQYVTTEVNLVIGNTACLVCLVCSFIGCIAGCCLVPFCISSFKDVLHKCPKCRSHLHTCTNI